MFFYIYKVQLEYGNYSISIFFHRYTRISVYWVFGDFWLLVWQLEQVNRFRVIWNFIKIRFSIHHTVEGQ